MNNRGQAWLSPSAFEATPTRRVEDWTTGASSSCSAWGLKWSHAIAGLCASRGGLVRGWGVWGLKRWGKGQGRGEKRQNCWVQKDISFAFRCGYNVCMHCQRDCVFPLPPWSEIVMLPLKFQIKCLCLHIRKMYKTFGHNHAEAWNRKIQQIKLQNGWRSFWLSVVWMCFLTCHLVA